MQLNGTEQYDSAWDWVFENLKFQPYYLEREEADSQGIIPFQIRDDHAVYGIEDMTEGQIDTLEAVVLGIFREITVPGERLYGLDWQHSAFLFDPRKPEEMQNQYVADPRYLGGGYYSCFPGFYPDGDYFFFLDEHFRFGYLSHPWREEVWVFGQRLVAEFEKKYAALGWRKLK